jgi:hypothetical protein
MREGDTQVDRRGKQTARRDDKGMYENCERGEVTQSLAPKTIHGPCHVPLLTTSAPEAHTISPIGVPAGAVCVRGRGGWGIELPPCGRVGVVAGPLSVPPRVADL